MIDDLIGGIILLEVRLSGPNLHGDIGFSPNYLATSISFDSWHLRKKKFLRLPFNVFFVLFCLLFSTLQDILSYHKRSHQRLSPGLYLGYLKLCSSVDQIKVLVTQKLPNILCHVKIRENNNISK